jgi:hypothetical protein
MNQPLNPVLKAPLQPKATPVKSPVARKSPEKLERLSMPESFALIEWLKAYKVRPGDSIKGMAVAAASALSNPKINENHVRQRMEEFGLTMPMRVNSKTLSAIDAAERLAKLEQVLATVIREQLDLLRAEDMEPHPDLIAFANER